jgi:hypothetical protein
MMRVDFRRKLEFFSSQLTWHCKQSPGRPFTTVQPHKVQGQTHLRFLGGGLLGLLTVLLSFFLLLDSILGF